MNIQLTVYVEERLLDAFKQAAFDEKRKVSHLANDAMREYLQKHSIQPAQQKTLVVRETGLNARHPEDLSKLIEMVSEQANAIKVLRDEILLIKSANDPVVYSLPQGQFTGHEEEILRIVCGSGKEGINHGVFQDKMASLNFRKKEIDRAVRDLMARALIKKRRNVYVYLGPGGGGDSAGERQS